MGCLRDASDWFPGSLWLAEDGLSEAPLLCMVSAQMWAEVQAESG